MRNINTKSSKFYREFYDAMYPLTGKLMSDFHKLLERASANAKYLKHYQFSPDGRKLSLMGQMDEENMFPLLHCKFDYREESSQSGPSFEETMILFKEAGKILENAVYEASGDELARILEEKMRYSYGYNVMKFIYLYAFLRIEYNKGNLSEAEKTFEMTETLRRELIEIKEPVEEFRYESSRYENAYLATWHAEGYDKFRKMLTNNHNWHSKK
jgi:hypothetical protein